MSRKPRVSIGLIVYNEVSGIGQSLDRLLRQSFSDFEILVGDNASNDGSTEIIEEIASRDSRIQHIRRPCNIGALQNCNDLMRRARGEFFVLAGGHDLWTANYLGALVVALDTHRDAVLAFAQTQWIDVDGNTIDLPTSTLGTPGMSRLGRFVSLMFCNQHYLYGMIRTTVLAQTRLHLEVIGSGELLLQELAQLGDFVLVENERWLRRRQRIESGHLERLRRYQQALFSNSMTRLRFRLLPHTQMMLLYFGLPFVLRNVPLRTRLAMLFAYPLILARFAKLLMTDIAWLFAR